MAFSFVVEDGTGLSTATSYISTSFADDYFEIDTFTTVWGALSTAEKEGRLAWATRLLDQKVKWKGYRTTTTQALAWPRTGVYTREGEAIASDEIPTQLKEAVCEMAKFLATDDPTIGQGVDYIKRMTLDVLEIEYQEGTYQSSFPSLINYILRNLGVYPSPGGFAFGKIVRT